MQTADAAVKREGKSSKRARSSAVDDDKAVDLNGGRLRVHLLFMSAVSIRRRTRLEVCAACLHLHIHASSAGGTRGSRDRGGGHTKDVGWTLHANLGRDLCPCTDCRGSGQKNEQADKDERNGSAGGGEGEGEGGAREVNTSGKEGNCGKSDAGAGGTTASMGGRQMDKDLRSINLISSKV